MTSSGGDARWRATSTSRVGHGEGGPGHAAEHDLLFGRTFWYRVAVLHALLSIEATASLREWLTDHIFVRDKELGRHLVSRVQS